MTDSKKLQPGDIVSIKLLVPSVREYFKTYLDEGLDMYGAWEVISEVDEEGAVGILNRKTQMKICAYTSHLKLETFVKETPDELKLDDPNAYYLSTNSREKTITLKSKLINKAVAVFHFNHVPKELCEKEAVRVCNSYNYHTLNI